MITNTPTNLTTTNMSRVIDTTDCSAAKPKSPFPSFAGDFFSPVYIDIDDENLDAQ